MYKYIYFLYRPLNTHIYTYIYIYISNICIFRLCLGILNLWTSRLLKWPWLPGLQDGKEHGAWTLALDCSDTGNVPCFFSVAFPLSIVTANSYLYNVIYIYIRNYMIITISK